MLMANLKGVCVFPNVALFSVIMNQNVKFEYASITFNSLSI